MGLSIYYSGRFNKEASLPALIEEVRDIAEIYKWKYRIYEDTFPQNSLGKKIYNNKIYGIHFTPPDCESISISFLSNGRMSSSSHLKFFGKEKDKERKKYLYTLFTKTQFAGPQIHKIIIHLLKYLSNKYLSKFKVLDDGHYWETEDEAILNENFNQYNALLDGFSLALQNFPMKPGKNIEKYFARLLRKINVKRKSQ